MAFILVRLAGLRPYDSIDSRWWVLLGVSWVGASLIFPISLASGLGVVPFSIVLIFVFAFFSAVVEQWFGILARSFSRRKH